MYIADMFCYGSSTDSVGVNGINGCMGVFIACNQVLYAAHMPDSINYNQPGRIAFANFVSHGANWNPAQATMVGVLNGSNRSSAKGELVDIAQRLNIRSFRTVRLRQGIEKTTGNEPLAAAVLFLFKPQGGGAIEMRYQMDKYVKWVQNQGEARAGQYRALRGDRRFWTSAAWGAGWNAVDSNSCDLAASGA